MKSAVRRGAWAGVFAICALIGAATVRAQRAQPQESPIVPEEQSTRNYADHQQFVNRPQILATAEGSLRGSDDGTCPQQTRTHSSHQFTSGSFVAQGGFVADEIAAVTYTIDPLHFPIRIDRIDGLFGTQSLSSQTTTHWSALVWEGEPNTGNLVYSIISDGKNPPHIVVGPPNNAVYLQAMVDPGDPDQIIVQNNGTNKFSVGFRIDQHNNPPTSPCSCFGGSMPAVCCAPNPSTNIFPTTDVDNHPGGPPDAPSQNWIFARSCPGNTCFGGTLQGWYTFQQLNQLGASITGDWNIRVLYTPSDCAPTQGACCLNDGTCLNALSPAQCSAQGGTFQGDGSSCSTITCPVPTGACCLNNGSCVSGQTQAQCTSQGGTWRGPNSLCGGGVCNGACCIPSTQQCVTTNFNNCNAANGVWNGHGTSCSTVACFGACCLPSGQCVGGVSPSNCSAQGGVFQGANSTCAQVNCPPPLGACCLGSSCLSDLSESDCITGFGGVWQGAGSQCKPQNPCDPLGACCLGTSCLTDLTQSDCTVGFGGVWQGPNTQCGASTCAPSDCPADIAPAGAGDGTVNVNDLLLVINSWGACPSPPNPCHADCAPQPGGDDVVNVNDLLMIINNWGACP